MPKIMSIRIANGQLKAFRFSFFCLSFSRFVCVCIVRNPLNQHFETFQLELNRIVTRSHAELFNPIRRMCIFFCLVLFCCPCIWVTCHQIRFVLNPKPAYTDGEEWPIGNALHFITNQLKITAAKCLHWFLLCLRLKILIIHKVTGQKSRQANRPLLPLPLPPEMPNKIEWTHTDNTYIHTPQIKNNQSKPN